VAAKTMAYDFVRHPFTRDINPLSLWLALPAGLASAILFRASRISKAIPGEVEVAKSFHEKAGVSQVGFLFPPYRSFFALSEPPLSPSFHPHSLLSDFRRVPHPCAFVSRKGGEFDL